MLTIKVAGNHATPMWLGSIIRLLSAISRKFERRFNIQTLPDQSICPLEGGGVRTIFGILILLHVSACGKAELAPTEWINASSAIGIQGYDPVAYHLKGEAQPSLAERHSTLDGVRYHFVSQVHQQLFEEQPHTYLPAYGGYCAYAMSGGRAVDINPNNWSIVDGQLYLNANSFAETLWKLDKQWHIENANEHFDALTFGRNE